MPTGSGENPNVAAAVEDCDGNGLAFGGVLAALRRGEAVTRSGWKTPGQRVRLVKGGYADGGNKAKAYFQIVTASGRFWPMTFGQRDLLARDWQIVS